MGAVLHPAEQVQGPPARCEVAIADELPLGKLGDQVGEAIAGCAWAMGGMD